ncbi:unnamed protein product [Allacma fusca]|uniref:Uncharacterized protein n=1 Tax=Allacma fusca TaxID=39272 RepID=A0A8J2KSY0_9HEXA|nr:unnamed protein product [Allacma fusca]
MEKYREHYSGDVGYIHESYIAPLHSQGSLTQNGSNNPRSIHSSRNVGQSAQNGDHIDHHLEFDPMSPTGHQMDPQQPFARLTQNGHQIDPQDSFGPMTQNPQQLDPQLSYGSMSRNRHERPNHNLDPALTQNGHQIPQQGFDPVGQIGPQRSPPQREFYQGNDQDWGYPIISRPFVPYNITEPHGNNSDPMLKYDHITYYQNGGLNITHNPLGYDEIVGNCPVLVRELQEKMNGKFTTQNGSNDYMANGSGPIHFSVNGSGQNFTSAGSATCNFTANGNGPANFTGNGSGPKNGQKGSFYQAHTNGHGVLTSPPPNLIPAQLSDQDSNSDMQDNCALIEAFFCCHGDRENFDRENDDPVGQRVNGGTSGFTGRDGGAISNSDYLKSLWIHCRLPLLILLVSTLLIIFLFSGALIYFKCKRSNIS